jgi:hypothetical protein
MTTKQEIKRLLKERAHSIVDERILPEILDNIAHWMGELMGKLSTLSADASQEKIDEAANLIYDALALETIKQLNEFPKKKKLPK